MWMQINQAWLNLAERERQLVSLLILLLLGVLFYSLLWSPIHRANTVAQQALEKSKNDWFWLNQQIPLVAQKPIQAALQRINSKTELMSFVQDELKSENLIHQMQTLQLTNKGVKVNFEEVNAPRLFRWLSRLEAKGLMAKSMQLTPVKTGVTQAQIEFEVAE